MSLLLNEPQFSFQTSMIKKIGMNAAIVLQHLHDLLEKKWEERDGYRWYYHTYDEWQEEFSFWSKRTIFTIMTKLEQEEYIISSKSYNKMKLDKTKWYRINYEKLYEDFPDLIDEKVMKMLQVSNGNSNNFVLKDVQQRCCNSNDVDLKTIRKGNGKDFDEVLQPFQQPSCNDSALQWKGIPQRNRNYNDYGVENNSTTITKELIKEIDKDININKLTSKIDCNLVYEITNYLNQKANKRFNANIHSVKSVILERLQEGYALEDFKYVIDLKVSKWLYDEKMNVYLRPSTLFSAKNFENYLSEPLKVPEPPIQEYYPFPQLDFTDGEDGDWEL